MTLQFLAKDFTRRRMFARRKRPHLVVAKRVSCRGLFHGKFHGKLDEDAWLLLFVYNINMQSTCRMYSFFICLCILSNFVVYVQKFGGHEHNSTSGIVKTRIQKNTEDNGVLKQCKNCCVLTPTRHKVLKKCIGPGIETCRK